MKAGAVVNVLWVCIFYMSAEAQDTVRIKTDFSHLSYIDSMYVLFISKKNNITYRYSFRSDESSKILPDEATLECFIHQLNDRSPFHFSYNNLIREYIEYYAIKKKPLTEKMLALAPMYFPVFEEKLDKYNVPLEFKYLPIVESAMNPHAVSPAHAIGLWQFIYSTGKLYGLEANSYWDDKMDTYKASEAAARHLRDLYNTFHDWTLALAAYNCGAGNVNKAIRRANGERDFWKIMPYLPRETRNYVPAFIAVSYIMEHYEDFNLNPSAYPAIQAYYIDTVHTPGGFSLNALADYLNIPRQLIFLLNPHYKRGIVPKGKGLKTLYLPAYVVGDYCINKEYFESLMPEITYASSDVSSSGKYHVVKKGETIAGIARKYHCSVRDIQRWNHLKGATIYAGQKLKVRP